LAAPPGDLRQVDELLDATSAITVATGIVNIWKDGPRDVAAAYHRRRTAHASLIAEILGLLAPSGHRR
jgi:hypothetical protein